MCFSQQRRAIFQHLNFKKCSEPPSKCASRHSGVQFFNISTSKSAPNPSVFQHFHFKIKCASRYSGVQFFNISTSKSAPNPSVFQHFHFKIKCASRYSGVQFFHIAASKSGPNMQCFAHFDFKMCFSLQRRAIFPHRNFKKWSEHAVFCTFWLQNVLLATAACNYSTSQLQKVVRTCSVLYIFTSKCASRHSGVQFLISPLTTWLRTRRFNEPTFRLTRHTNHQKNTAFRDFSNIWRGCIFFLLTFALLHLLSSDSTSSSDFTFFWLYFIYLLFICFSTLHVVGSLLFKLPSIRRLEVKRAIPRGNRWFPPPNNLDLLSSRAGNFSTTRVLT